MGDLTRKFDYSQLTVDEAGKLKRIAIDIRKARKKTADGVLEFAEALATAQQELANYRTGLFGQWVEAETGISKRTAYNWLSLLENFGDERYRALMHELDVTAAIELTKSEDPKKAIKAAKKAIDKGESVTVAKARQIAKETSPQPAPPDDPEDEFPEDGDPAAGQPSRYEAARAMWSEQVEPHIRALSAAKRFIESKRGDADFSLIAFQMYSTDAAACINALKFARPAGPCPQCEATGNFDFCEWCRGRGWLNQQLLTNAISAAGVGK